MKVTIWLCCFLVLNVIIGLMQSSGLVLVVTNHLNVWRNMVFCTVFNKKRDDYQFSKSNGKKKRR